MSLSPLVPPERVYKFKVNLIFLFFSGIFLLTLPYIVTFLFTSVDFAMTIITRVFIEDGNLLSVAKELVMTIGPANLMYVIRDIFYFCPSGFCFFYNIKYFLLCIILWRIYSVLI